MLAASVSRYDPDLWLALKAPGRVMGGYVMRNVIIALIVISILLAVTLSIDLLR